MPEKDALSNFDFNKVTGSGLFLKFRADVPLTLRILTVDPVISETEFTDKATGEITLSTRFAFIVYNFTEEKAQILQASPAMARKIGELHTDPDFGANIRKIDIKITPTGEMLERRYDIQVLPKTRDLTREQIQQAQAIDLEGSVKNSRGRMSSFDTDAGNQVGNGGSDEGAGYQKAKQAAAKLKSKEADEEESPPPAEPDPVFNNIDDDEINLDDIPF